MPEYIIDAHIEDMDMFAMYKILNYLDDGSVKVSQVYPNIRKYRIHIIRSNLAVFYRKATETEILLYA